MRYSSLARVALGLSVFAAFVPSAAARDWPPIDPADLALKQPAMNRAADAEGLLWDVYVTDERDGVGVKTVLDHYLRIKVFTERGRETQSKVDLSYANDRRVREVQARTVSPDGTPTEIPAREIFDRTIVEAGGTRLRTKSFVLPAVVPGSIIEYQWREVLDNSLSQNLPLPFQRDIAVQVVRYHVKPFAPLRDAGYAMRFQPFRLPNVELKQEADTAQRQGYTLLESRRMPAFQREPYSPPERAQTSWVLLYYTERTRTEPTPEQVWTNFSKSEAEYYKDKWKVSGDIKTAATAALAGTTSLDDKVDALLRTLREKVKRNDTAGGIDALLNDRVPNRTASDTLKRGAGTADDVALLFAAMAQAGGLDVRLARLQNRGYMYSSAAMQQPFFFDTLAVAIKDGASWRFVDAANPYSAHGHVRWQHEGLEGLVMDPKAPALLPIPNAEAKHSLRTRTAALTLLDDGSLEGTVTIEYTGHLAVDARSRDDDQTDAERKKSADEALQQRLPGAETTAYAVKNLGAPEQPYTVTYTVRVPDYAQRAGSRLIVAPHALERGRGAFFSDTTRWQEIDFRFGWTEQDTITLQFPPNTVFEGATPEPTELALGRLASYKATITPAGQALTYTRELTLLPDGKAFFGPEAHAPFKKFFESVRDADHRTITVRRSGQ